MALNLMISLHVRTLAQVASELKEQIEKTFNAHVWICTNMTGGQNYRDEIVKAIDKAYAVILLVNNDWAESAECEDEYNYAKRLNLTSKHNPRKPLLLPIAFPDLDWQKRSHVRLLMSSTNAIVIKNNSEIWPQLKASLEASIASETVIDNNIDFNNLTREIFIKFTTKQVLEWVEHASLNFLKKVIEENSITGIDLADIVSDKDLESFGLSAFQIKKVIQSIAPFKVVPKEVTPVQNPAPKTAPPNITPQSIQPQSTRQPQMSAMSPQISPQISPMAHMLPMASQMLSMGSHMSPMASLNPLSSLTSQRSMPSHSSSRSTPLTSSMGSHLSSLTPHLSHQSSWPFQNNNPDNNPEDRF